MKSQDTKQRPILFLAVLLLLVILSVLIFQKPTPIPAEDLDFSVGDKVTLSDVITKVKGGRLVEADRELNSSKNGSIIISYTVKNLLGIESDKEIMITFHGEEKEEEKTQTPTEETPEETVEEQWSDPVIEGPDEISIRPGGNIDLSSFSASDHEGTTLEMVLSGQYDTAKMGKYTITLSAADREGRRVEKTVVLNVLVPGLDENGKMVDGSYKTANGKTLVIAGGIAKVDGVLIANKTYSLPRSYSTPYLLAEAENAFFLMKASAREAGLELTIKSARRSWNDQNKIFNNYVKEFGLEETLTFSARPGHSEHQTGLAMDMITADSALANNPEVKAVFDWLNLHAYEFGYVLRYPENKEHITGYIFEPWHYRYVGTELAKTLYNNGDWITLEEYFGIDSAYHAY